MNFIKKVKLLEYVYAYIQTIGRKVGIKLSLNSQEQNKTNKKVIVHSRENNVIEERKGNPGVLQCSPKYSNQIDIIMSTLDIDLIKLVIILKGWKDKKV